MKKTTLKFFVMLSIISLAASCKKEGCTDPNATNYNSEAEKDDGSCVQPTPPTGTATAPGTYIPNFSGEFAALIAIKTITTTTTPIGTFDTEIGTAVAAFTPNAGSTFEQAGTVTCEAENLTLNANNSYIYMIESSNPMGLSFSNPVNWNATGSTWPAFSASTNAGFSTLGELSSGTVNTSTDYTLTSSSITNADSVLFAVYGPDGNVMKVKDGSSTSHTFSAAELSGIGAGSGYIQVVGLNYDPQTIATKNYYLINETVRTKSVTIQ